MKYFALLSAVSLAGVSAYFSVYGLVHIFALSMIPMIVMGSVLEVGKIATALFIHRHWKQLGLFMKGFLLACTVVLAILTSMGIFGFLAKSSQGLAVQISAQQSQVDFLDERLNSLETLKKEKQEQLKHLDSLVGIYSSQSNFRDAKQATRVYARQSAERKAMQIDIRAFDEERLKLTAERLKATDKVRTTEVDVGPAVYVAQAIYGKKDIDSVESAIRIIIFMIIFAFDPLAICLMIAIQKVYYEEKDHAPAASDAVVEEDDRSRAEPALPDGGGDLPAAPAATDPAVEDHDLETLEAFLRDESLVPDDTRPQAEEGDEPVDPRDAKIRKMLERWEETKARRAARKK